MDSYIIWDKILEDLKGSFSAQMFGILFDEAKLIYITNQKLAIQVDDIAYSFLQDKSTPNYIKFVHIVHAHLGRDIQIRVILPDEDLSTINSTNTFDLNSVDNTTTLDINSINFDENDDSFQHPIAKGDDIEHTMDVNVFLNDNSFAVERGMLVPSTHNERNNGYNHTNLSRIFKFDNYFYSHENRKVIRACKEIISTIQNPGFNPVFISGESGIGKTHLINALGNEIFDNHPLLKIKYTTGPTFMNDYTSLFKGGINNVDAIDDFKQEYYNLDVLIIDDIQLLEGKETTLNEFFSLFETLIQANKQVIITADKDPSKIQFEPRLITRFLSGLDLKLRTPDSDTKKQIFNYYAREKELNIDEDAIQIFIENSSSVRALIGYINSIHMHFINDELENEHFTKLDALEFVNSTTGNIHHYTPSEIIGIVATHFDLTVDQLREKNRKQVNVDARSFAAYFLYTKLKLNFSAIANYIGVSEHTTASRAYARIEEEHAYPKYKDDYIAISNKLNR